MKRDLPILRDAGVRVIINCCEEFVGHTTALAALDLRHVHVPIVDYRPPTFDQARAALEALADCIRPKSVRTYTARPGGPAARRSHFVTWFRDTICHRPKRSVCCVPSAAHRPRAL